MRNQYTRLGVVALSLLMLSSLALAEPLLTIVPADYTYQDPAAALGATLSIPYQITNNTPATLTNISASQLATGITSSTCDTIAPNGGQCTLTLTVAPSVTSQPGLVRSAFQVCANNPPAGCTRVNSHYELQIHVTNDQTFLAISDIHLSDETPTPITYGQDTGDILWASTQSELTTLISQQKPKFMLLLGDLPAHHDMSHLQANLGAVLTGLSGLPAISTPQLPVFYAPGNNDSLVGNYNIFSNAGINLFSLDPTHNWPALNSNPDCSVSPSKACTYTTTSPMPGDHENDMAHAQSDGYYSAYPLGRSTPLRLIILNSMIFSFEYALSGADQLAPAQTQMDWLAAQLASASTNGEAVYIAMHIPPGQDAFNHSDDFWNDTLFLEGGLRFRDAFLALITQYQSHIRAIFTGHTHLDELRALYSDHATTQLTVLDVGIPGITPQHYNNPGMKTFLYNNTYDLMDAKTFYTTPSGNSWSTYSFQNDYSCPLNSTMLSCLKTVFLPKLPSWKLATQPIPGNIYETDYSVRVSTYNPSFGDFSSWLAILNAIQVAPIV